MTTTRVESGEAVFPQAFSGAARSRAADVYLSDSSIRKLADFFETKGLAALKDEDRREQWYDDWIAYQAEHRLYAAVLSPKVYSTLGSEFDLLRYARFLEVFGYFGPAHGYSLQVTFLGLFAVLMGSNAALKKEAVAALEAGGLLAFGVSEKNHGSDLLAGEFTVKKVGGDRFVANGTKYYIGNANCASIISILARKDEDDAGSMPATRGSSKRTPFVLFALRPNRSPAFRNLRKIHTLGVRAGYVGEFEVKDHELPQADVIAEGRGAWDAVLGTVTLGKFFLGFGSIGICEHAIHEAIDHLSNRIMYGKPVIEMPHIRSLTAQAYARLTAMKLYAYRALDYVRAASPDDRRYLLYCAVQKAKVSTEGVKVMSLLSECIGAKGFESDTYFEMALRDAQLIPGLEGSTHINLGLAAQFIPRYFGRPVAGLAAPDSMIASATSAGENGYLMEGRTGGLNTIGFPHFLNAYRPYMSIQNVRLFARQAKALRLFLWGGRLNRADFVANPQIALTLGQCLATIAYGQLIAENAAVLEVPTQMISAIFQMLVTNLTAAATSLASLPQLTAVRRALIGRLSAVPRSTQADWDLVFAKLRRR